MSVMTFSSRIKRIEVSAIKQMALKAEKYENVVSFGWGVPSFRTLPVIREAAKRALDDDPLIDRYSPVPGLPELRRKIALTQSERFGFTIVPQQILITTGAMEGMMCLMQTLFDPGDEVLVMDPGFSSHIEEMELTGVVPRFVSLDESHGWGVTEDAIEQVVSSRTKGVILINPNNPTGHVFTRDDIKLIARVVKKYNLWLVLDEPYTYLVYDGCVLFHPLEISEIRDQTILVETFSKKYSMSGWRVGYVVAPSKELILELMKVHDATSVSVARVCQIGALRALDILEADLRGERKEMQDRRDLICQWLSKMPDLFSFVRSSGAYYIFPKIITGGLDDLTFAHRLLDEIQVVVIPGYAFGPTGRGHVRFCFSGPQEEINKGCGRILEWWQHNKRC